MNVASDVSRVNESVCSGSEEEVEEVSRSVSEITYLLTHSLTHS